jgi:hypothetical protein
MCTIVRLWLARFRITVLLGMPACVAFGLVAGAPPQFSSAVAHYYVAVNGNDNWRGSLPAPNAAHSDGPFASPARALLAVRHRLASRSTGPITVILRGGTYYLPLSSTTPGTLAFTAEDSGGPSAPVVWESYPNEVPILSGGEPIGRGGLGLTWTHVSGALWRVYLPAGTRPFEYLFYNGARRLRSRLQSASPSSVGYYMRDGACLSTQTGKVVATEQCNLGTYLRVAETIPATGANAGCPSMTDFDKSSSKCMDRFKYHPDDPVTQWANLNPSSSVCGEASNRYPKGDIEVILIEAWTAERLRVSCVDTTAHTIYFTAPTRGSYKFFGPANGRRYIVENAKNAFDAAHQAGETGIWFLDRSTSPWALNYLAAKGEDPNTANVVIAQIEPLTSIGASLVSAVDLRYVSFRGITFEVDNFVPGPEGFNTDENSEDTLPEAIDCESCQHVIFDGITVRRTSASGILIASTSGNSGAPAANDSIINSAFYDIGDSGIRIGHRPLESDKEDSVVQSVTVENNIVQGYSRVFVAGIGIAQANGHDISYLHNDVTDGYHAGISLCWLSCPGAPVNGSNLLTQYNHLWNIMQGVTSDGGILYYNVGNSQASGTRDRILSNLVHDGTDSSIIDGSACGGNRCPGSSYGARGIYLDAFSSGVDVENNVVYNMSEFTAFQNEGLAAGAPPNTFHNNIFAYGRRAMFAEQNPFSAGCGNPSLRANITNNIFYFNHDETDGFYVDWGCAWSCGLEYDKFLNFQGNLYWRTDGGFARDSHAFHVDKDPGSAKCSLNPSSWTFLSFDEWQDGLPPGGPPIEMREDKGSTVTVDPQFGHTGRPSDFLLSKSPIAGFDYTRTNDTIRHAGRSRPLIMPPPIPPTFPAYSYEWY